MVINNLAAQAPADSGPAPAAAMGASAVAAVVPACARAAFLTASPELTRRFCGDLLPLFLQVRILAPHSATIACVMHTPPHTQHAAVLPSVWQALLLLTDLLPDGFGSSQPLSCYCMAGVMVELSLCAPRPQPSTPHASL